MPRARLRERGDSVIMSGMSFDSEKITFFAKTDARGANVPFGIKAIDRTKHVYVIGKTGMGKSTLLENMAVQDIQNGEGMAFIDPHGQTAEVLLDYVPPERKDDVLYFAPFDTDCPVAFNVMEDVGPEKRHLVVSGLMSVFKKIWVDAWSARMEYILQNTLLALLEYPDSTLLGVNRMLSDKKYRRKVIDNISDPAVKAFWVDEFLNYNERYMQEAGDSIKNKIGQFTANPLIRNIIGQPKSSFDLRQIMDEKKILIMNLSKGLVGESNANLLGSMLTTRIYLAAMSRADLSVADLKQKSNFYFYVDEFQSFANATFADILSEARKYKLNLTIAHQYVEQMEEEVKNAVFGNVGTTISFRVGPFDAEVLETIFAPQFYAVDICNLEKYQIYLSLMIDGVGSKPFSATTLPPIEPKSESCKQMVIHASRMQFASTRAETEKSINDWMIEPVDEAGAPKNDRPKAGGRESERRSSSDSRGKSADGRRGEKRAPDRNGAKEGRSSNGSNDNNGSNGNKEKNLDDLRSILKSIAPKDEAPAKAVEKPKKSERSQDESKERQKTESADQKQADLAAAIKQTVTSDKKVVSKTESKPVAETKASREKPLKDRQTNTQVTKPASVETVKPTQKSGASSGLRSALAAVLDESPIKTPAKDSIAATEAVEPPTAPATKPANEYTEIKNKDPFDPKKLERMMRVTTADKTPLK